MKVMVIFAHPDVENRSVANKAIINQLSAHDEIEIRDLYRLYPDFNINVEAEQKAMETADLIILQYPIHWYSVPGMLKEWMDRVWLYGWAFGSGGDKLKGKMLQVSITVGGSEEAYQLGGSHGHTVDTFLSPVRQSAELCDMQWKEPIVSHDMVYIPGVWNEKEAVEQRAENHVDRLLIRIQTLCANHSFA